MALDTKTGSIVERINRASDADLCYLSLWPDEVDIGVAVVRLEGVGYTNFHYLTVFEFFTCQ